MTFPTRMADLGQLRPQLVERRRRWTVGDQLMKREIILHGMGWGHMPTFLIAKDLQRGRWLAITGKHFPGASTALVAARRRDRPHGPVADRLWRFMEEQAAGLRAAMRSYDAVPRADGRQTRRPHATPSPRRIRRRVGKPAGGAGSG